MNRKVVITGMGAITPLGNTVPALWEGVRAGRFGVGPIKAYDASAQKVKLACEVDIDLAEHLTPVEAKRLERYVALALIAGRQALRQSGITAENTDLGRCGTLISSGVGGLSNIVREQMRGAEKGFDRVSPFFIPMAIANMAGGQLAIDSGFRGYCSAVVTACAGGANALGDAMRAIRHGYADAMLCGGSEACVLPLSMGGFTSMKALHEGDNPARASIPFDAERSGFVLGEGAGVLVLEAEAHARARGAEILGYLSGYGATCDAHHITAPEPSGQMAAAAMSDAIRDAGLTPADIGYINAHGTSTPLNDKIETAAVRTALGARAEGVPISSTKSMTGHLLGAAGAVEAILCLLALREGFIPATIGYQTPDPECNLDIVPNTGRSAALRHTMSNSLGFGGHNASLILSKA